MPAKVLYATCIGFFSSRILRSTRKEVESLVRKAIILIVAIFLLPAAVCQAQIKIHYAKTVDTTHRQYVVNSIETVQHYFREALGNDVDTAAIYVVSARKEIAKLPVNQFLYGKDLLRNPDLGGVCYQNTNIVIVIIPNTYTYQETLMLVAHELTHRLQDELTQGYGPNNTVMIEGTAQYVAYKLAGYQPQINMAELETIAVEPLLSKDNIARYSYIKLYNRAWWEIQKLSRSKSDYEIFQYFNVMNAGPSYPPVQLEMGVNRVAVRGKG